MGTLMTVARAESPQSTGETTSTSVGGHRGRRAFTLTEMLVVIFIIMVLLGLIVGISGYVNSQGQVARVTADIRMMGVALQAYRDDNGFFPVNTATFTTMSTTASYTDNAG